MTAHLRAKSDRGFTSEVAAAPARRPSSLKAGGEVAASAKAQEAQGRPLPVFYAPLIRFLVTIATGYGLVTDDAYRLVSTLTRETWRSRDVVPWVTRPANQPMHR